MESEVSVTNLPEMQMEVQIGRAMGLQQSRRDPVSTGLCGGPIWHVYWGRW